MSELDKLEEMLQKVNIPYKRRIVKWEDMFPGRTHNVNCVADIYFRNQIIYPNEEEWLLDAICQYGSYGREQGMLETYGLLGSDDYSNPRILNHLEVFKIISDDWRKRNEDK